MPNPLCGPVVPRSVAARLVASTLLFGALAFTGCEPAPGVKVAGRPLPAYAGHSAEIFDDVIEPAAVGISLDVRPDPHTDKPLRERAQLADAVLRARVTTVTARPDDRGTGYILGVKTVQMLSGHFPPGETFEVTVASTNPTTGIIKAMEGQIVGKSFIGFVRAFVRPDGDQELHFHLAADTKDELGAVQDAIALAGL